MEIQTDRRLELPEGLQSRLEAFRRRVWTIKLTEGALAALFGLLVSYLAVFASDRVWDTPAWLRTLFLVVGSSGLAVWLPFEWHRWVWSTRRVDQVARLVRRRLARLGDRLLGVVELVDGGAGMRPEFRSDALCRAALRQVDEETGERELDGAVPPARRRPWAWAAAVPAALTGLALTVVPAAGGNALARWLTPWRSVERYTFAQLDDLPAPLVVPYAESFSLAARLRPDTAWSPSQGSVRVGEQEPVAAELKDGAYQFRVPPQKDAATLTVSVGDAHRSVELRPEARPELTDVKASVTLPAYLGYSSAISRDVRGGSVSLVAGSVATFEATATRELASAMVDGEPARIDGSRLVTVPVQATEGTTLELTWRDRLGLSAKKPFVLSINVVEDEEPTLTLTKLSRERIVLEDEVLSFEVLARDDYGVKAIGMDWTRVGDRDDAEPQGGEKLVAAGRPEQRELEGVATFSAKREGLAPQTLELRLFVVDYFPERERVYSPTFVIHVLSAEEHAIWLTGELRKWFRAARNVHERELQLHETNRELRRLDAEELDRTETRRRIESQAAAESSNARRLSALTAAGEGLIKQAARNDQFNVATMEAWAGMLHALKDIAANRMPSVADLLGEAVRAPRNLADGSPRSGASAQSTRRPPSPGVGVVRDGRTAGGGSAKADTQPRPSVPTIADVESGVEELRDQNGEPSPSSPGSSRLGLPVTVVQGGGRPPSGAACPTGQKVEEAVAEQEDLLAEFEKVADELQRILDNLEGSTFVKRLKAASRAQSAIATGLSRGLDGSFGVKRDQVDYRQRVRSRELADREVAHSEIVYVISEDLAAYSGRVQQSKFKTVLKEMRTTQVVTELRGVADTIKENRTGSSMAHAEFWADTLDRWAEQLVGPG